MRSLPLWVVFWCVGLGQYLVQLGLAFAWVQTGSSGATRMEFVALFLVTMLMNLLWLGWVWLCAPNVKWRFWLYLARGVALTGSIMLLLHTARMLIQMALLRQVEPLVLVEVFGLIDSLEWIAVLAGLVYALMQWSMGAPEQAEEIAPDQEGEHDADLVLAREKMLRRDYLGAMDVFLELAAKGAMSKEGERQMVLCEKLLSRQTS